MSQCHNSQPGSPLQYNPHNECNKQTNKHMCTKQLNATIFTCLNIAMSPDVLATSKVKTYVNSFFAFKPLSQHALLLYQILSFAGTHKKHICVFGQGNYKRCYLRLPAFWGRQDLSDCMIRICPNPLSRFVRFHQQSNRVFSVQ